MKMSRNWGEGLSFDGGRRKSVVHGFQQALIGELRYIYYGSCYISCNICKGRICIVKMMEINWDDHVFLTFMWFC